MSRFGQTGVIAMHIAALIDLDRRYRCAKLETMLQAEGDPPHLGDIFQVDDMLGAAYPGAELDNQVGAAAQGSRFLAVPCDQFHRLFDRSWSFVSDSVQAAHPPGAMPGALGTLARALALGGLDDRVEQRRQLLAAPPQVVVAVLQTDRRSEIDALQRPVEPHPQEHRRVVLAPG